MQRRAFGTALVGLGAFAIAGGAGHAAQAEGADAVQAGDLRPVRIHARGQGVTIRGVNLSASSGGFGVELPHDSPGFPENRIDLSRLAGVFRQPFRNRWTRAHPVGIAQLSGGVLSGAVDLQRNLSGLRVTIAAGDFSWDLRGSLLPMQGAAVRGADIGAIRIEDGNRLLIRLNATPIL